jgi:hypothetical protein
MTQREKVTNEIKSIIEVYNNLAKEHGFDLIIYGSYYPRDAKVYEMKQTLENFKNRLNELNRKIEVKKYYLTDEGSKVKSKLESKREKLYSNLKDYNNKQCERISKKILAFLDDDWTTNVSDTRIEIGLKDIKENKFNFLFGHSFEFYLNTWSKENKLEMNYGTMGAFDVLDDNCFRPKYLLGMASIANNKELISELRSIMIEWRRVCRDFYSEIDDIEKVLKNPLAA